ncbi:MAG: type IV pilin-like G/H family protein [Microcoleus sp.]
MTKNQESSISSSGGGGCGCLLLLICIGVGAINLPSFLNPTKPKQSEPKQYVSSMSKGQQAYFAEKSVFSTSVEALGLGLKTETANYKYSVRVTKKAAFSYAVSKQKELKSYVGGVFLFPAKGVDQNGAKHEIITTQSIICEADSPGAIKPAEPTYQNGEWVCGKGTTRVTK